jgi:hypothetical protein
LGEVEKKKEEKCVLKQDNTVTTGLCKLHEGHTVAAMDPGAAKSLGCDNVLYEREGSFLLLFHKFFLSEKDN